MAALPQAVARQVTDAGLSGARLLVAVSGGPDSMALLHALHCLGDSHGLDLHVAHVDHGLRPSSAQDAEFVRHTAASLGLPCTVASVDVPQRRDGSFSEAAARNARYRALAEIAAHEGAAAVALGHTLDDQAETALLHAVRGAGLPGLRAMTPVSDLRVAGGATVRLFRPLLGLRRAETQAYCASVGLTPVHDESNDDTHIPRNLVRLEVVPLLERLNPRAVEALARMAETAGGAMDFMEAALDAVWPELAAESGDGVALDRRRLTALYRALRGLAVLRAHRDAAVTDSALDAAHVSAVLRLAAGPSGKELPLPGGVRVEARHDALVFHAGDADEEARPLEGEHPLTVPGVTHVGGWRVEASYVTRPEELATPPLAAYLDADVLGGPLCLRSRRPGDRFQPLGMAEGSKKLQDYFVDAHVPRRERDGVPLLVAPRGIAWVVGHGIAHWARVTPDTERALRLEASPPDG